MAFCTKCGTQLADDANFCAKCGTAAFQKLSLSFSSDSAMGKAVSEISAAIDNQFDAGTKIALVGIASSDQRSNVVMNDITALLTNSGKLNIIDRSQINLIMQKLNLRFTSNGLPDASLVEIGRSLGAQLVISGTMTIQNGSHRFTIRVLNAQTGLITWQYQANIPVDKPKVL